MKELKTYPLVAMCINSCNDAGLEIATPQNFDNVVEFITTVGEQTLAVTLGEQLELTCEGVFMAELDKHPTLNYYSGVTVKGNKVQVSLKKMVGSLRVWS